MKDFLHNLLDAISLRPRYLALESEGPTGLCKSPGVAGATGLSLDLMLQPWLESRGEWIGRRPAIWIDDVAIGASAAKFAADKRLAVAAVAVHEASHVAAGRWQQRYYSPGVRDAAVELAAYAEATRHRASVPPFYQHGWQFVRLCVHARHRARMAGCDVPGSWVFDGGVYELPSFEQFEYSLLGGAECEHLAAEPIDAINSFRPPKAFEELWQRSLRAWLAKQTKYSDAIRVAIDMVDVTPVTPDHE